MQGYKVYYTNIPTLPFKLWTEHEVEGSGELTTIGNLRPNHTYTISVLAYNSVGDGPRSEPKQVITRQGGMCGCVGQTSVDVKGYFGDLSFQGISYQ